MDFSKKLEEYRRKNKIEGSEPQTENIERKIPAQVEETGAPYKETVEADYLTTCHNYVFAIYSAAYLFRVGLHYLIDKLQIGYDTETKEITLPLDGLQGKRYFAIKLKFDRAADEEAAQKVLQFYNLKPYKTTKDINGSKNDDEPYSELGKALFNH